MADVKKSPLLKNGIRIFRPAEFRLFINAIPKIEYKDKVEALLYSGARYNEMRWLYENKKAFKDETYIEMPSMKPKARHKVRIITLNNQGRRAVSMFLRGKKNLPTHIAFDENYNRWAIKAGLDPAGISVKSTRKTWECWLCKAYPQNWLQIFLSQGHTEKVSMEYYTMLPFTDDELKDIQYFVDGWI